MAHMKDFRDLKVWQKAHQLVLAVYKVTRSFPGDERFGLTSQLRRSIVSIASNISEGCGRSSDRELARFLDISAGSSSETEYQLLLARDLGYIDQEQHHVLTTQVNEVRRMLHSFIQKLKAES